jgi:hypothetical protein
MSGFSMNQCQNCGVQLAPDDFDGVCCACDELYDIEEAATPPPTYTVTRERLERFGREALERGKLTEAGGRCYSDFNDLWLANRIAALQQESPDARP